ncbi:MAG: TonB-dependent receptor [Pseudomonadota bacterium]
MNARTRNRLLIATALSAFMHNAAGANDAASDQEGLGAKGEAAVRLASLDEITVYATRSPTPAFSYPGQVTVIDRAAIDDFNPSTLFDVFDATPGAQFQGGPRRTGQAPSVRGVEGEGVLVLLDGARQSFLSGHDGRFFIDPDLVQAVEVVRGPTSALYGSGALGGVIALRTITADDFLNEDETTAVKLSLGLQSVNDEVRFSGVGAWRSEDGKTDIVANLTKRASDDIKLGSGFTLPSEDDILSSLLKATSRLSDAATVSLSWTRYGGDSLDPNNPQGVNTSGSANNLVNRDIDSNTVQGVIDFNPSSNDLIDASLTAYYARNEVREDETLSPRLITREVDTIGVVLDNRSRFTLSPDFDVTLTYGGEFYRDEQTGADNTTIDGTRGGVPDATSEFYGVFGQAEIAWTNPIGAPGSLTIIPGVRWDSFSNEAIGELSVDDNAVSPKVGVSYQPIEALLFFGNWAEAFRAPSFNELYADGIHFETPNFSVPGPFGPFGPPAFVTNFFIANPDLEAEESTTWEVGGGLTLDSVLMDDDSFQVKGSYFQSDVENLIDLDVNIPFTCFLQPSELPPFAPPCGSGAPFGNTSQNVNVTNADLSGVEVEFEYDSRLFYVRANYGAIDGRNKDNGDFVGVLTPDIAFIDSGVKWAEAGARLGARVTIAGDFNEVNTPTLARDGYTVGDVYFVWEPQWRGVEGLRLDLGVDNITDADYEVVAAGVSQPGRNYKATISMRRGF